MTPRVLWAGVMLPAASTASAAPPAYCTGHRLTDDAGVPVNDYGDEIRYSNGARVRNGSGEVLYPGGTPVKSAFGDVRYPNGQRTRDAGGVCYFETGVEMNPCQRAVEIRERLAGGETVAYRLDLVAGTLDLRSVRYEFPARGSVAAVAADLVAGRIDRGSIAASCGSGAGR